MNQQEVEQFILGLENVEREENMGYLFFFVGDYHMVPFATIGYADNEGDKISNLDREGVFRLNLGISKTSYDALFADTDSNQSMDYTALDIFMPHPHYAQMFYICILNPSEKNEAKVKELILEAHGIATKQHEARQS